MIRAGELALGVLDGEERAAALRRVIADPAFAREVERWRDRLSGLHEEWPEADPGPAAERRAASHHVEDSSSSSAATAERIRAAKSRTDSPSYGRRGAPKRTVS